MIDLFERLKGLRKNWKRKERAPQWSDSTSNKMDEVFFYDPYEKKVEFNMRVTVKEAAEAVRKMHLAMITAAFSCDEIVKGTKDAVRHMGSHSGT